MTKIRISRKAISDFEGIWDYTATIWSTNQATTYYRQISNAIQGLNRLPTFFVKAYDYIKPGLMGYKVGHHIIFYRRISNGSISVDRILHEKMDYQRHL